MSVSHSLCKKWWLNWHLLGRRLNKGTEGYALQKNAMKERKKNRSKTKTPRSDNSLDMILELDPNQEVTPERSRKPVMTHRKFIPCAQWKGWTGNVFCLSTHNSVFYLGKRSNIHICTNYCCEYINRWGQRGAWFCCPGNTWIKVGQTLA